MRASSCRPWPRALSRVHQDNPYVLRFDGMEYQVNYEPGESNTGLIGGNSNWRAPRYQADPHWRGLAAEPAIRQDGAGWFPSCCSNPESKNETATRSKRLRESRKRNGPGVARDQRHGRLRFPDDARTTHAAIRRTVHI